MATDKPRIQAYIEPELYDLLLGWKKQRGIAKESEALNQILKEYFGMDDSKESIPTPQAPSFEELKALIQPMIFEEIAEFKEYWEERGKMIESIVSLLEKRIEALEPEAQLLRRLLTESIELTQEMTQESNSLNATRSPDEEEIESIDDIVEEEAESLEEQATEATDLEETEYRESPGNSPSKLPDSLNGSELGRRLGVAKSVISRRKAQPNFYNWTKSKDPEAIAWRYDRKKQNFSPVR